MGVAVEFRVGYCSIHQHKSTIGATIYVRGSQKAPAPLWLVEWNACCWGGCFGGLFKIPLRRSIILYGWEESLIAALSTVCSISLYCTPSSLQRPSGGNPRVTCISDACSTACVAAKLGWAALFSCKAVDRLRCSASLHSMTPLAKQRAAAKPLACAHALLMLLPARRAHQSASML